VYIDLQSRKCESTRLNEFHGTEDELNSQPASLKYYIGAIAACMAAFHGGRGGTVAERALAEGRPGNGCLDDAVRDLLQRLVDAHRRNPTLPFVADTSGGAAVSAPCPRLTLISPTHGKEGQVVTITGQRLDDVGVEIVSDRSWNESEPPTVTRQSAQTIEIEMPAFSGSTDGSSCTNAKPVTPNGHIVCVAIRDGTVGFLNSMEFTYDA